VIEIINIFNFFFFNSLRDFNENLVILFFGLNEKLFLNFELLEIKLISKLFDIDSTIFKVSL